MKLLLLLLLLMQAPSCPIDGSGTYLTGRTKADATGYVREYKCLRFGHTFWGK